MKLCALLTRVVIGLALICSVTAFAQQDYPSRPIRVVVPYSPGGNTDLIARHVMKELAVRLGQPVVIENRPGANSIIGTDTVAKAPADGYTLGIVIGAYTINTALYRKLPYGPDDLTPVTQLTQSVLVLETALPDVVSFADLVRAANDAAAPLTYATSGAGSFAHLQSEQVARVTGMKHVLHVPYKGTADALKDVMSGRIGFTIESFSTLVSLIQTGKVKALAVTSRERSPMLPDVPTLKELGYPELVYYSWNGVVVPAGTPPAIIERLSKELSAVLKEPVLRTKLIPFGVETVGSTPAEFASFITQERKVQGNLIRQLGLTME